MKDITLKITGKQLYSSGDNEQSQEEQVQFITEGKLTTRGDTLVFSYEESELSGMPGCITQMSVTGDVVRMTRKGEGLAEGTEILFEKGKRYSGSFDTPYGPIKMEVLTTQVDNKLNKDKKGHLAIDYDISLAGISEGRSRLELEIV
ncbi:DUF1934 domain-containing protein [bacterium]|jgi:uncharacterized beta-barrel protein YwiB (DUF1934 family)|nr:DUF1934 domain-containing protein [bacterium]